jgi:DNA-binding response OmpR family regulator
MTATTEGALILVADDDPDILELVCFRLEQAGYRTERAGDGEQALERLRELEPDLCVLDVMMPKLSGLEVLREIRSGDGRRIPVILLTASVQDSDVARGFDTGADDYIRKPFNPRELQSRVDALLRRG